jgi:hypothetical protein
MNFDPRFIIRNELTWWLQRPRSPKICSWQAGNKRVNVWLQSKAQGMGINTKNSTPKVDSLKTQEESMLQFESEGQKDQCPSSRQPGRVSVSSSVLELIGWGSTTRGMPSTTTWSISSNANQSQKQPRRPTQNNFDEISILDWCIKLTITFYNFKLCCLSSSLILVWLNSYTLLFFRLVK